MIRIKNLLKRVTPVVAKERYHQEKNNLQQAVTINREIINQLANDLDEANVLLTVRGRTIAQLYEENGNLRGTVRMLTRALNPPSNWKTHLWNNAKNLTLIGLAVTYQGGYYHGSTLAAGQINSQGTALQPNQLINYQGNSVNYNSTYSWEINQLTPNEICSSSPLQNFYNQLDNSPQRSDLINQNNNLLAQLNQRPNVTVAEYNNLLDNRKPTDLPDNWPEKLNTIPLLEAEINKLNSTLQNKNGEIDNLKKNQIPAELPADWKDQIAEKEDLKNQITELQKRPTSEQLIQAVQAEKDKHRHLVNPTTYRADWINPINLENEAKKRGMVSAETYNQRPDLTLEKYDKFLNNQRPIDLPPNWKSTLAQLPKLEDKIKKQKERINSLKSRPNITSDQYENLLSNQKPKELPQDWKEKLAQASKNQKDLDTIANILPELINETGEFKENEVSEILNELKSRPNQTELAKKINEAVAKEADKYKDHIDPNDITKILDKAKVEGYQFKQNDIDDAIKINNQTWIDKGLINPLNPTELEKAGLANKLEYEQLKKERENRPNITLSEHEKLVDQKEKVQNWLTEWTNTFPNSTANQVKQELAEANQGKSQAKTDLNKWVDTFGNQTAEEVKQAFNNNQNDLEQKNQEYNKLLVDHNELKNSFAKTQQQVKKQSNFMGNILQCLTGAGIAFKAGQKHKEYEIEEKYLKDIQTGIEILIRQKKEAEENQQQAEQERDYYKNQAQNNHSASGNSSNKSDNIQTKTEIEREIIQQLNDSLKLNFSQTPTLPQVISRIQELIKKDPLTLISESVWEELNQIPENVTQLENTPFGEDLEVIKSLELTSLEELFPGQVDSAFKEQIQQAINYQQVVSARQAFLAKHLGQKIMIQKPFIQSQNELVIKPNKEKIIWITLLMMSLLTIGGLLVKFKKKNSKKSFKK